MELARKLFVFVGVLVTFAMQLDSVRGAQEDKEPPLPNSPILAQQLLNELYKDIEAVRAEVTARVNVRAKLDLEIYNAVQTAKFPSRASANGAKLLQSLTKSNRAKEDFTIEASPNIRRMIESIQSDVFDQFLTITDMERFVSREAKSTQDRITSEVAQLLNRIIWDYSLLKETNYLLQILIQPTSSRSFRLTKDDIERLENSLKPDLFESLKTSLKQAITDEKKRQDATLSSLDQTLTSLRKRQAELQDIVEQGQAQIDIKILKFGLPAFGIILLGILLIPKAYHDKDLQTLIFSSGIVLDMFTVFLLTMSILLLGLSQRVHENVLGTLLGGISGYVLGRTLSRGPSASVPPIPPAGPPIPRV